MSGIGSDLNLRGWRPLKKTDTWRLVPSEFFADSQQCCMIQKTFQNYRHSWAYPPRIFFAGSDDLSNTVAVPSLVAPALSGRMQ